MTLCRQSTGQSSQVAPSVFNVLSFFVRAHALLTDWPLGFPFYDCDRDLGPCCCPLPLWRVRSIQSSMFASTGLPVSLLLLLSLYITRSRSPSCLRVLVPLSVLASPLLTRLTCLFSPSLSCPVLSAWLPRLVSRLCVGSLAVVRRWLAGWPSALVLLPTSSSLFRVYATALARRH